MELLLTRPDRRRRDISNYVKAIEDLLVTAGLIEDDSLAQRIVLEWTPRVVKGGAALVTVIPAEFNSVSPQAQMEDAA